MNSERESGRKYSRKVGENEMLKRRRRNERYFIAGQECHRCNLHDLKILVVGGIDF
jgi:hypothetical protein